MIQDLEKREVEIVYKPNAHSLLPVSPELEKLFIVAENWKKNLGKTRRCC